MFGKRLRECRKQRKMTQQDMADRLNLALRSYQRYEAEDFQPSLEILIAIADTLDTSIDYLLGRDDFLAKHADER